MIERDGNCISLWQDYTSPYESNNTAREDTVYDVLIVGGGITGITTGLLLQEAGKRCLLLEAANLCFGTTGGTTAHLNTLLDVPYSVLESKFSKTAAKLVAVATRKALELVHRLIKTNAIDCEFENVEAYLFAVNDKQAGNLNELSEASARAGLQVTWKDNIPLPIQITKAICVSEQARFNPTHYVYALAAAFEKAGGVIRQHCRVVAVNQSDPVQVESTGGTYKAIDLVYATHIPPGVNLLHLRCLPYRSYALATKLKDNAYPHALIYDMEDPYHYYRSQTIKEEQFMIAGGKDHRTGQEENPLRRFRELEAHIRKFFQVDRVSYRWSSQFYESADGLPYIGKLPGHSEHILTATGFGGNGMIFSHVAAMILTGNILRKPEDFAELFTPSRIKPVAGFSNFLQQNSEAVKEMAGKLFLTKKLKELVSIAAGEGKVVKYEGQKIAIYKDLNGQLHTLKPSCRHLQCDVKWNKAELSWDCPCHGARYSYRGEMLTGPSDSDLRIINLVDK